MLHRYQLVFAGVAACVGGACGIVGEPFSSRVEPTTAEPRPEHGEGGDASCASCGGGGTTAPGSGGHPAGVGGSGGGGEGGGIPGTTGPWAGDLQLGTSGDDMINALTVDAEGNLYFTGYEQGSFQAENLKPTGNARRVVARYDRGASPVRYRGL